MNEVCQRKKCVNNSLDKTTSVVLYNLKNAKAIFNEDGHAATFIGVTRRDNTVTTISEPLFLWCRERERGFPEGRQYQPSYI